MLYLLLKLIHIAAVVVFLGNIITGLFWKAHADRSKNPQVIAVTLRGIILADRLLTLPGIVIITLAGIAAAIQGRYPILGTGWILWAIIAFSLSGVAFSLRVAPLQAQLSALAEAGAAGPTFDWATYHTLSRQWDLWGLISLLLPLAALTLMVLKPALPAF